MHRLKRWINEEVSFYKEQLKESPLQTIAIYLSWVFVIIIGLMAVFAYIKFIIDGGYPMSVARVKENGAFASANFTSGTIYIISNNVVWIILAIIICIQTLVSIILMFAEKVIWKWILFVIDLIAIVFCFVKMVTGQNNSMSEEMRLIYSVVTLIAIIVFFKLLIDSDGSYVFLAEGLGLAAYLIILALILLLENIVAIGALVGAIIIVGIVAAILIFGNSSKESAGSTSSGSGSSTSYKSSSGNVGVKSRKPDKKTANTPAYKKDSNPNHHYIANYNEILGIKLYKVHGDMEDYIELDNTMVEKKICSLADAESGKHKFYREESGKEIRVQEIPWK